MGVVNDSLESLGRSFNVGRKNKTKSRTQYLPHHYIHTLAKPACVHMRMVTAVHTNPCKRRTFNHKNKFTQAHGRNHTQARTHTHSHTHSQLIDFKGPRCSARSHEQSLERQRATFNFKTVLMRFGEKVCQDQCVHACVC